MMTTTLSEPRQRWWRLLRLALTLVFFAALIGLLVSQAGKIDWAQVLTALRGLPASALLIAAAATALSYSLYVSYELLSVQMTGTMLQKRRVAQIAFVSYAFNLNLGAWVGGIGFRYRLYSRFGLDANRITRILGASMMTNWIGYTAVGGVIFALGLVQLPPDWKFGNAALELTGIAQLLGLATYLLFAAFSRRRGFEIRGHRFELPRLRIALTQTLLASVNWLTIAFVVYTMMQGAVAYPTVLAVFLLASIAGVATHIPAGLGVLEAVYLALLGHLMASGELLGALLAYRAIYYLVPLLLALLLYAGLEARARRPLQADDSRAH